MSDEITGRKYSEDEQQVLRQRLLEVKDSENRTWRRLAVQIGVPDGTLSNWAGGTYGADGSKVAEKVERWLRSLEERATFRASEPITRFVNTPSALDFLAVLGRAQALAHIVVLTGAPGIGKSRAACQYKATNPNVYKITASKFFTSVPQLLSAMAREMSLPDMGRQDRIAAMILRKIIGSEGLIIVDEAQLLTLDQLEAVRSFHDQGGIGLALIGNPSVMRKLEGEHRGADYAQFFSRVGMRLNRMHAKRGDMEALLEAWGVEDPQVHRALCGVAKKAGALRGAAMTFRLACTLADAERTPVNLEHVKLAWERISNQGWKDEAA